MLQIAGVLVLAAGVPAALEDKDFATVTYGYVVMRVAMVAQWLRVARQYPPGRDHAVRYAIGVILVQIGWLVRLTLPDSLGFPSFVVLAAADLAVPFWAELRTHHPTPWHPNHIAERYGLFTIIVLGESILAATVAMQAAIVESGPLEELVLISVGGLVLIFGLWWTYFDRPAGEGLRASPASAFRWGYGPLLSLKVSILLMALAVAGLVAYDLLPEQHRQGTRPQRSLSSLSLPVVWDVRYAWREEDEGRSLTSHRGRTQ
jgi:low temperature requirement protein LtrA